MKHFRGVLALTAVLVLNVVLVILLTPLGFESRPTADLKVVGYAAIAIIFTGLILDVASIILLFWKTRWASLVAIIASILFFFPIVGDLAGYFFSIPIPPVIRTLEYIFTVVLLVTVFLASMVCRAGRPSPSRWEFGWSLAA
jgi:hypothetical protein